MGPMGPHGPMRPMGPPGMMPPPHPIQMEMHNIRGQLNHLYSQPPNPQIQQQVNVLFEYVQCPLDKATLDIAAALAIATSTPVTNLRQYINSDLGYNDLKF